jgi:predicted permease
MWWLRARLLLLYAALRRRKIDDEIDEELQFHLEMRVRENVDAGMSAEQARQEAVRRFGSILRVQEDGREIRRGATMDGWLQDIRYAFRMLSKQPKFTAIVALTMALGVGANTAIFSVVNAVLLKPLPYERPAELALIWSSFQKMGASRAPASGVQLREIRDRSQLFADVAGIWVGNGTFTGDAEPEQVKVASVTPNFFAVLGAKPAMGRAFHAEQDGPGINEIILSNSLWLRRFGADPNIIGQAVRFSGGSFTVVGVMPPEFLLSFPADANVPMDIPAWIPFQNNIYSAPRDLYYIRLLGRLKSGATVEQAQDEANAIAHQLRDGYTEYNVENLQLEVVALHRDVVRDIKPALVALFIGAGLVLLVSCFNVANLLLTRASTRRKEIALRVAIGATRWLICRQLLCESLLICCLAGALALAIALLGLKLLLAIRPESLARLKTINPDWTILAFVGAISLTCGLIAGLAPVLETGKVNLVETLKESGRTSSGQIKKRLRTMLIGSEIAFGFVLLVGAGLMIRTLIQLHRVSPGFNANHVLTFEIIPPGGRGLQRNNFVTQLEEKLSALPGVESVGAISHLPLDDYPNWYSPYAPEGVSEEQRANLLADHRAITPGYFQAMGGQLIAGRTFNNLDTASSRKVVIIDKLLAQQTWPDENPIGKKLNIEMFTDQGFANDWAEVVGVVEHIKAHSLLKPLRGEIYIPYTQSSREHLSFAVRTSADPSALVGPIRGEINKLDRNRAIAKVRPMEEYVRKAMAPTNFTVVLASLFAALALLLATVGIYSVISYSVSRRTQEIGVRMALGATGRDILRLIMKEGAAVIALGLTFGFVASLTVSAYLQNLLFDVPSVDPITYLAMAVAITLAALLACLKPALEAASCNPIEAIRQQ